MTGSFVIAADHPALPGHFPGHPVVPGVVLLDEIMACITGPGRRVTGFPSVQFLRPVQAGERVDVTMTEARFAGSVEGAVVVQGTFVMGKE